MIRKSLVNDLVRSFVWVLRTTDHRSTWKQWPHVILQQPIAPSTTAYLPLSALAPFVAVAYSLQTNYLLANSCIVNMAAWLRNLNTAEQEYAVSLLERFYGYRISTRQTVNTDDQSHFW